jgi:cysteine desulfurase/selenocysteine lyase
MSNVLGTVTPMKEIIRIAHAHGVPVLVDGAPERSHLDVDVQDLDADFYVFTGHKVYGPTGIGVLYGKRDWLAKMPPYQGGGEMISEVLCMGITYGVPPHRFEAGTRRIVEAIGLGAAVRFMMQLGRRPSAPTRSAVGLRPRAPRRHELGPHHRAAPGQGPILSFEMNGAHAHDVATVVDRQGVAVRAGTHCAMPLLTASAPPPPAARRSASTIHGRKSIHGGRPAEAERLFAVVISIPWTDQTPPRRPAPNSPRVALGVPRCRPEDRSIA